MLNINKVKPIALGCAVLLLVGCSSVTEELQGVTGGAFDTSLFPSAQSGNQGGQSSSQGGTQSGSQSSTQEDETTVAVARSTSTEIEALSFPNTPDLTPDGSGTVYDGSQDVTITESGTYTFSGTFNETTITVDVDKDADDGVVYLVLDGVSMTSENGTPLYIIEAKDVVIVLADGSTNTIYQGAVSTTDEDFPSGAIYTKADTVITGSGSLSVTTLYNDAIHARDDLVIDGASITIDAASDGIVAKDLLAVRDATLTITAGKDGLKTTNTEDADKGDLYIVSGTITIDAQGDGISAERTLQIDDGTFKISSGGGFVEVLNTITVGEGAGNTVQATDLLETSMKGVKANDILINGGNITVSAYEDAFNADNTIIVNGSVISLRSGDDGMTADNALTINDIDLLIAEAYEGLEGDYLTINGGMMDINVLDDAINGGSSDSLVLITGGTIYLTCQGDGIDSNGDLTITGGYFMIDVNAIYTGGDGALDVTGTSSITGGTFVDGDGNTLDTSSTSGGTTGMFSFPSNQQSSRQSTQRR